MAPARLDEIGIRQLHFPESQPTLASMQQLGNGYLGHNQGHQSCNFDNLTIG